MRGRLGHCFVTIDFNNHGCDGNAGFFFPGGEDQPLGGPAYADINGMLIKGGNFSFRMGTPGSVRGLKIVNNAWDYGPLAITDAGCSVISPWEAKLVTATADEHITGTVRDLPCR